MRKISRPSFYMRLRIFHIVPQGTIFHTFYVFHTGKSLYFMIRPANFFVIKDIVIKGNEISASDRKRI